MLEGLTVVSEISHIYLENFRAFSKPSKVELGKITLLYGQNSAGKSSIVKTLLMLQQSLVGSSYRGTRGADQIVFSGESVDLGSFATAVTNHDTTKLLTVGIGLPYSASSEPDSRLAVPFRDLSLKWTINSDQTHRVTELNLDGRSLTMHRMSAPVAGQVLDLGCVDDWCALMSPVDDLLAASDHTLQDLRLGVGYVPFFSDGLLPGRYSGLALADRARPSVPEAVRSRDTMSRDLSEPIPRFSNDETVMDRWDASVRVISRLTRETLWALSYVGPLRREPQRLEKFVPSQDRHVGAAGEQMLSLLYENDDLVLQVNNYLGMMDLPYRIRVVKVGSREALGEVIYLALVNKRTGVEVSPSDAGVGYSQVLPLIAQAVLSRDSVVCIEQPELHLHPAMQARLGDLFIDQALGGNNVQFVIETHSESLMLRILRRIREGKIEASKVKVLYIDQDDAGASEIHDLPITADGEFAVSWPKGFFDERLEEIGF